MQSIKSNALEPTRSEWATLSRTHANLTRWLERMNARACMQATTWERVAAMAAPLKQAS